MKIQNIARPMVILVSLLFAFNTLAEKSTNSPCIRVDITVLEIKSSDVSKLPLDVFNNVDTTSNSIQTVAFLSEKDKYTIDKMFNSFDSGANILAHMSSITHNNTKTMMAIGGNLIHYADNEKDNLDKLKSIEGPVTSVNVTPTIDGDMIQMDVEFVRRDLQDSERLSEMHYLRVGPPLVNHQAIAIKLSAYSGSTTVFQGKAASKEKDMQVFFFVTLNKQ